MPAIDFPASPSVNATHTVGNRIWKWNGTTWDVVRSSVPYSTGATGPTGPTGTSTLTRYKYTAAAGATGVSGVDDNTITLAYTAGKEQLYLNGVLLVRGTDYTATNGTAVTGMTAMSANDVVEILTFENFNVADAVVDTVVDAKGDLIVGTAADTVGRLGVGTNNHTLIADSAEATGLKYAAGSKATLTTTGDIIYASAANTPARLGIGTTGQSLVVAGGVPTWAAPAASTPTFVGCSLYNSSTLSFANNTETTITYDSEYIDTHAFHDNINPSRITIPTGYGGKYLISAANRWVQNSNGVRNMGLYVNNNSVVDMMNLSGNATTLSYCFRSLIYTLAAGDFIQIRASQTTGSTWDMYNRTIEMPFSVQWLGA